MDEHVTVRWSADSAAPGSSIAWVLVGMGLSASPGVAAIVFPLTSFASSMSQGVAVTMVVLGVIVVGFLGSLTVLMVLNHRAKRRELVEVRLRRSAITVFRVDGTTGSYSTSVLTEVVVEREHLDTTVMKFRRLKLTFGDRSEKSRPGHAEDDESFGTALAALNVPIKEGVYVDYDTVG